MHALCLQRFGTKKEHLSCKNTAAVITKGTY